METKKERKIADTRESNNPRRGAGSSKGSHKTSAPKPAFRRSQHKLGQKHPADPISQPKKKQHKNLVEESVLQVHYFNILLLLQEAQIYHNVLK